VADHPLHEPVLDWYRTAGRDLPWRRPDCTPWGVLVSEIMLQQTPVVRVLPVWQAWLTRWPTPRAQAAEPAAEAIRLWGRLGYPRRALRLHEAAGAIVAQHEGRVPAEHAQLRALPGIGDYTAAAVATFAFGQAHPVLDVNVRRVLARAVRGVAQPEPAPTAAERSLAVSLVPADPERAVRWATASMELGALQCTARTPDCSTCPVLGLCRWQELGAPPATGAARRVQGYEGTDRQVRGRLLGALRKTHGALTMPDLVAAAPDAVLRDPGQRDRCLAGLLADGLVEPLSEGRYALPGTIVRPARVTLP